MNEIGTPTLDKIKEHQKESNIIGCFLEWLNSESPYSLMEKKTYIDDIATKCWGKEVTTTDWHFTHDSIEQILANYFDIDLKQANKERDAIYKQMVKTLNQTNER